DACTQDPQCLCLVLVLTLLILAGHHHAGGDVGDAYGGVGRVDALPTRAAAAVDIDTDVLSRKIDFNLLGFGQDRHRGGRGVDAPAGLGHRHTLDPVDAALMPHVAIDQVPLKAEDNVLDAPPLR